MLFPVLTLAFPLNSADFLTQGYGLTPDAAFDVPVFQEQTVRVPEEQIMPRLLINCGSCGRSVYTGLTYEDWFVLDIQGATAESPGLRYANQLG